MKRRQSHIWFMIAAVLFLLKIFLSAGELYAQNGAPVLSDEPYSYIPLTSFSFEDTPFDINSPLNFLAIGNGFRAYCDIKNTGAREITSLHTWLLIYFQNRVKPVLYEHTFNASISPGDSHSYFWDEPKGSNGVPVAGVFVPFRIVFGDGTSWSLPEYYASNGTHFISPPLSGNAVEDPAINSPYHRNMTAMKISEPPVIDGVLDDPVWQRVEFHGNFLQREPNEGAPATEPTEIALAYDEANLYFAGRLFDSEPDKIRATEMRRDAIIWDDDYLDIVFDTFHDHRNAFYFSTNPNGMRLDGTIGDEGKIINKNWDGVWECKTSIDEKGWYIEIAIPWQTLRFKEGDNLIWGAHFRRRVRRKNEETYWRLVPRSFGPYNGQFRVSQAGKITDFNGLQMGGKFEIKPFATSGLQRDEQTNFDNDRLGDVGIDVKANITSTMTADFTYNTDFAQVEADQERINLTRFDLFFPEKREFFLEGAETFRFGINEGNPFSPIVIPDNIQLFHSRRIGIEKRSLIPIFGGTRVNGKIGKYTLGMLSIQAEKTAVETDDGNEIVPETNFSVFRLKRDLLSRSNVGIMFLNKEKIDGGYNRTVGFDSKFYLNNNLSFFVVGAGTYSPDDPDDGASRKRNNFAGNAGFNWESDRWRYGASFLDIEDSFIPEMGFVRRAGIKRTAGNLTFSQRPDFLPAVRKIDFTAKGYYQTDVGYRELNKMIQGQIQVQYESSVRLSLIAKREFEYLDFDWEVRDDLVIPEDEYTNTQYQVTYNMDRTKSISARLNFNGGNYYTGTKIGGWIDTDIKLHRRVKANINYSYNNVNLSNGTFHTNRLSTRASYAFNPDFFIKAYIQWLDDKLLLEGKDRVTGNILLRYTYMPGSDFYLILNQESLMGRGNDEVKNRMLLAKFTYFFRK